MEFFGIDCKGEFKTERVSTLPEWTSDDIGREVFDLSTGNKYVGGQNGWIKAADKYCTSSGYLLEDMITDIGSNNETIVIDSEVEINSNITIPENIQLDFKRSGKLNIDSGIIVTIYSPANIDAANNQHIFDGDGVVTFSNTAKNISIGWHTHNTTPGTTDMSDALTWAIANTRGNTLILPEEIIGISETIDIYGNTKIKGMGRSIVKAISTISGPMFRILQANYVQNDSYFGVSNLKLDGNNLAQVGFQAYNVSMANYEILNKVYVTGCTDDGIQLYNCQGGAIRNIRTDGNDGHGAYLEGCNSFRVYSITARSNGEDGLHLTSSTATYSGGVFVFGGTLENNNGRGLFVGDLGATPVMNYASGLWIEINDRHGVEVDGGKLTLVGCFITGSVGDGTRRAMKLTSGGPFYAHDNELTYTGSVGEVSKTYLGTTVKGIEDDIGNSIIGPNYNCVDASTIENTITEVLGENIVTNGDAETGDTTSWSVVNDGTTISADSGIKYVGSYSFKVETTNNWSYMIQTNIPIIEGVMYKISMKGYIPSSGGVSRIRYRFMYDGDDIAVNDIAGQSTGEWFDIVPSYFIGTSDTTLGLWIGNYDNSSGDFYVDNIKVQPVVRPAQRAWQYRNMLPIYMNEFPRATLN